MKIALAQINPTVGDIAGNLRKIKSFAARAKRRGAQLVAFPELCITGYPPRDLVEHRQFVDRNQAAVRELARAVRDISLIVGFVSDNTHPTGKRLCNSVALLTNGELSEIRCKQLLPTYDVFDETRNFAPGTRNDPVAFRGKRLGLTICEDMWNEASFWPHPLYSHDPVAELARLKADVQINISSSPFHRGKNRLRLEMLQSHVRQIRTPFLFVNQVGGNDDLIFDGHSLAVDANGRLLAQA